MKTITFTSEFFTEPCAPSVMKALQGNTVVGRRPREFISAVDTMFLTRITFNERWLYQPLDSITFNTDGLEVDWACLLEHDEMRIKFKEALNEHFQCHEESLEWLAKLTGVEVIE